MFGNKSSIRNLTRFHGGFVGWRSYKSSQLFVKSYYLNLECCFWSTVKCTGCKQGGKSQWKKMHVIYKLIEIARDKEKHWKKRKKKKNKKKLNNNKKQFFTFTFLYRKCYILLKFCLSLEKHISLKTCIFTFVLRTFCVAGYFKGSNKTATPI